MFTITVLDVSEGGGGGNTPPTLTGVPVSVNVSEGEVVTFDADATDPDAGQTLTFCLDGAPAGASFDTATGVFAWTPTEAQGPDTFVFNVQVSDGLATTTKTAFVIVREVNDAPALAGVPTNVVTLVRGETLEFTASAADADLVVGLANALTYSLVNPPPGAFIDPDTGASPGPRRPAPRRAYAFKVRVADDGVPARSESKTVAVNYAVADLTGGLLRVGGTAGNDVIAVGPLARDPFRLAVVVNKSTVGTYLLTDVSHIAVRGLDGNDKITVNAKLAIPADLYGDGGNDALTGGAGADLLVGGAGKRQADRRERGRRPGRRGREGHALRGQRPRPAVRRGGGGQPERRGRRRPARVRAGGVRPGPGGPGRRGPGVAGHSGPITLSGWPT